MHIFLMGEKQVGKTTILRNFLETTGASADGFITYWETQSDCLPDCESRRLYLGAYGSDERYLLAEQWAGSCLSCYDDEKQQPRTESKAMDITQVFDTHGKRILNQSGKCDFLVIDELGTLENDALAFQYAVMQHIKGKVPILGVLRKEKSHFLDKIRTYPMVAVKEVTAGNRTDILRWLIKKKPYL